MSLFSRMFGRGRLLDRIDELCADRESLAGRLALSEEYRKANLREIERLKPLADLGRWRQEAVRKAEKVRAERRAAFREKVAAE